MNGSIEAFSERVVARVGESLVQVLNYFRPPELLGGEVRGGCCDRERLSEFDG
jgi:hypothetical protein